MNSIKLNRMHQSLLSLGVLVIGCFIGWNWVLPADDALITQRYVLNYLEYGEPYFNRNDGVMGFSSPAYFLILSALSWVFSVEVAYKLIASLSYIATGVILFFLLPHSAGSKKIWFLVIFIITYLHGKRLRLPLRFFVSYISEATAFQFYCLQFSSHHRSF